VRIHGYLAQMGPIVLEPLDPDSAYENPFFCPDPARLPELEDLIWRIREAGDSIGARVTVTPRVCRRAGASRYSIGSMRISRAR
jgi:chorismate synthase